MGLMVRHDLAKFVMAIRRVSPRIISMDIVLSGKAMSLISVYAPQRGRREKKKTNCMMISVRKCRIEPRIVLLWGILMGMLVAQ